MDKLNLETLLTFSAEKSTRKALFTEGELDLGLLLYKPGQTTPDHKHSDIDEFFYIISGQGTITIDHQPIEVKEKDIIFSPRCELHGFQNTSSSDWIVLQIKLTRIKEGC